ncbi:MAG: hypothetical protein GY790_21700 [Bacteroidetes bacterium]|nr:hypothetical protein [Bacteroidota bacterium]
MNKLFSGIAMISIMLLTLTGCESDNKTLLSDGVWDFENMTTDSEDEAIKQFILFGKAALTDGTLEFNSDETFIMTAPLMEEPQTGTWSLIGDDQLIMNGDDDFVTTGNIENLSKKELKYHETFVDENMDPYTVTSTWTRD